MTTMAVGGRSTTEVVPFHNALKAPTFGHPTNLDTVPSLEYVRSDGCTDLQFKAVQS
jgi:hypothetical protein